MIDVFTPLDAQPFRLELDGDRIESLRTFDPDTQRSSDQRKEVVIIPVREASLADLRASDARRAVEVRTSEIEMARLDRNAMSDALENGLFFPGVEFVAPYVYPQGLATIFGYLPADVRLWIDDPAGVESAWDSTFELIQQRAREAEEARRFFAPAERFAMTAHEVREALRSLPTRAGAMAAPLWGRARSDSHLEFYGDAIGFGAGSAIGSAPRARLEVGAKKVPGIFSTLSFVRQAVVTLAVLAQLAGCAPTAINLNLGTAGVTAALSALQQPGPQSSPATAPTPRPFRMLEFLRSVMPALGLPAVPGPAPTPQPSPSADA